MAGIGIVGIGISGLHLALYLQQRGLDTTLYAAAPMTDFGSGPLVNIVSRWGPTLQREAQLGVADTVAHNATSMRVRIPAAGIEIVGRLCAPAQTVDFRLYLPRLLDSYLARGGTLEVRPCGPEELSDLTPRHDLVVVAAGRDGFGGTFSLDPARSPHRTPPRYWTTGLYRGADFPTGTDVELTVVPGVAEIFHIRMDSRHGPLPVIGFAAVPGGPLEALAHLPRLRDPDGFAAAVLEALGQFAPHVRAAVDPARFGPAGPGEIVQGGFVPYVRQAWTHAADGRCVMAVGDAWVLNDPIMAQGANLGSRSAFVLGEAIAAGGPYDEQFCRRTEAAMWSHAIAPCILTEAFLGPPSDYALGVLAAAGSDPVLADRVVNGLGDPADLLALLTPATAPV